MRGCGASVESSRHHRDTLNHDHIKPINGNLEVQRSGDPVWDAYCRRNTNLLNLNSGAELPYEVQIPRGRVKIRQEKPRSLMENLIEADYTNIWPCTNQGTVSNFDYDCCSYCCNCPDSYACEAYNLREAPQVRPICDFRWCKKTLPKSHMTDRQLDGLLAQYLNFRKDCCPPCDFEHRDRIRCPPPPPLTVPPPVPPTVVPVPKESVPEHDKVRKPDKPEKRVSRCKQHNQCYLEEINIITKTISFLWKAVISVFPFLACPD